MHINLTSTPAEENDFHHNGFKGLDFTSCDWDVDVDFDTEAEANEFAARFPKYCKARVEVYTGRTTVHLNLRPSRINAATGAVNEADEKRKGKIKEILNKLAAE